MITHVNLVQRGVSALSHPVSGKSGRLYGQAVSSPQHGGVLFRLTMKEYADFAHDIVGQTAPGQQWVPELIGNESAPQSAKCDRCPKAAIAIWDRFYFCGDHAPDNAILLDGSGQTVGLSRGMPVSARSQLPPLAQRTPVLETALTPPVEDRLTNKVEGDETELDQEHFRAPVIGTEHEDSPPEKTGSGTTVVTEQPRTAAPPTPPPLNPVLQPPAVASPAPQPPARPDSRTTEPAKPAGVPAIEAITTAIVDRISGVLPGMVEKAIDAKFSAAAPPPAKPPTAKPAVKKAVKKAAPAPRPASEFSQLQGRAKELGINSFGKKASQLKEEIAAKEKPAPAAKPDDEEIPF
jgi:hypothetical protein